MNIIGFKYDKETKIIKELLFFKENIEDGTIEYINDEIDETENIFKTTIDKVDLIKELIDFLNEPEELVYLPNKKMVAGIGDIVAKKIYYDSEGHLSNLNDSEVIDLEGLKSINVYIGLFNKIKNKPHKIDLNKVKSKRSNFYDLKDIDSFIEYGPREIENLDVNNVLDKTSKALADTKIQLMQQQGFNNTLISEIANLKIELMQMKGEN
ncbi:hypothetical protein G6Z16_01690 [Clostridium perfringens]|uniref:hypothetical protein n=1 Tax=Clostridium perfringens TaxID=1502 RepID=UPI0013E4040C|nr:hypothetical protein [Clostridium perfringens]NGT65606.1 hypothetical protein [Clostridium perfringens]